jgi:hypothetical protein
MKWATRNRDIHVLIVCWLAHIVAIVIMMAFYGAGRPFGYSQPVDWGVLFRGLANVNWTVVSQAMGGFDWLLLIMGPLGIAVAFMTRGEPRSWWRIVFFALQPLIIAPSWLGMWMIALAPLWVTGIDGEIFHEHWPSLIGCGLWGFASLWMLFRAFRDWKKYPGSRGSSAGLVIAA